MGYIYFLLYPDNFFLQQTHIADNMKSLHNIQTHKNSLARWNSRYIFPQ